MPKPDYRQRLQAVQTLGRRFPGMHCGRSDELGLFAGIYLQTKWQMDSGRDVLPIWHVINRHLTLTPFACQEKFLAGAAISDPAERLWLPYFQACVSVRGLANRWIILRGFWRAHTAAMRLALTEYQAAGEQADVPVQEIAFWRGWIRFVLAHEKLAPPTLFPLMQPFLGRTMPLTSPLCPITLEKERAKYFLKFLIRLGQANF